MPSGMRWRAAKAKHVEKFSEQFRLSPLPLYLCELAQKIAYRNANSKSFGLGVSGMNQFRGSTGNKKKCKTSVDAARRVQARTRDVHFMRKSRQSVIQVKVFTKMEEKKKKHCENWAKN